MQKVELKRTFAAVACWLLLAGAVAGLAELARTREGAPANEARRNLPAAPATDLSPAPARASAPLGTGARPAAAVVPAEPRPEVAGQTSSTVPTGPAPRPRPASRAATEGEQDAHGLGPLPPGVPPEEEGVGVTVLRQDGQTVQGAEVRWATSADLARLLEADPGLWERDDDEILARLENKARTGPNGWTMVPSLAGRMVVDARYGDSYASRRFDRAQTSYLKLPLFRDVPLPVEVVDGSGAAFDGLPLVVRAADGRDAWSAATTAGRALLLHAPERFAALAGRADLHVLVDAPQRAEGARLERGAVSGTPVRLVARRGGTIKVRVLGPDGVCAAGTVEAVRPGAEPETLRLVRRRLSAGTCEFVHAEPGLELLVRARGPCGADSPEARVVAPAAGATLEVELRHATRMPRVRGLVVDIDGRRLEGWTATLHVRRGAAWEPESSCVVGSGGAFEFDVPALASAAEPALRALVVRNEYGATKAASAPELSTLLDKDSARADTGLLRLENWTIQLAGSVVDEAGRPVEGAQVELEVDGARDARTRAATAGDGRFELRAPRLSGAVSVMLAHPALREPARSTAKAGDRSLQLQIALRGRVAGRLVPPEGVSPQQFQVVLLDPAGGILATSNADSKGAFAFERVEPGEVQVLAQLAGLPNAVVRGGGATVAAGSSSVLAEAIDLRVALRALVVEIVDEEGRPVEAGSIGPRAAGRERVRPFEFRDGSTRLVAPRTPCEFEVQAEGFETAVFTPDAAPVARVVLKRSAQ